MKRQYLVIFIYTIAIIWIFKSWFSFGSLSSGDWDYQYSANLQSFSLLPYSWDPLSQNGLGGNIMYLLPLLLYYHTTIYLFFHFFHLPWIDIERIAWFWPFLGLSFFSMFFLSRKIFKNIWTNCLAGFIYLSNTYILMIVGGGQMGYALAYSLVPIVLEKFIVTFNLINNQEEFKIQNAKFKIEIKNVKLLKASIINGLVLALLFLFDIRVTYIVLIAIGFYVIINLLINKITTLKLVQLLFSLAISSIVTILLHAFWLLPLLVTKQNPVQEVGAAYTTISSVKFFSFATFENALGLLHPNWPENIFGKIGFMRPEFLVLPLLAFSSLLFLPSPFRRGPRSGGEVRETTSTGWLSNLIRPVGHLLLRGEGKLHSNGTIEQWNNKTILDFAFLGLIGIFLAKGANDPFGGIYVWLFSHVPGFVMFRDPTKWYVLIILSYSILIPYSLSKISNFQFQISNFKSKKESHALFIILYSLFFVLWLFLIRQAVLGQLNGTLTTHSVPQEYTQLESMLNNDQQFYRTLWVPTKQRYGFSSSNHPAISAADLFHTSDPNTLAKKLEDEKTLQLLKEASIKYIIVPDDSEKEIYLKNHRYNELLHSIFINTLDKNRFITSNTEVGNIKLYSLPQNNDHFWLSSQQGTVSYQKVNPVTFSVAVNDVKQGDRVVFSDSYDSHWVASNPSIKYIVSSIKYNNQFNSFILPKNGNYTLTINYEPQRWVNIGVIVSVIALCVVIISLLWLRFLRV